MEPLVTSRDHQHCAAATATDGGNTKVEGGGREREWRAVPRQGSSAGWGVFGAGRTETLSLGTACKVTIIRPDGCDCLSLIS